jgi:phage terminase large subunit-like protein
MAPGAATAFQYDWRYRARPEQLPPDGSWRVWLLMAGRGFGKTRCGAEWVRAEVHILPSFSACWRAEPISMRVMDMVRRR